MLFAFGHPVAMYCVMLLAQVENSQIFDATQVCEYCMMLNSIGKVRATMLHLGMHISLIFNLS